MSRFGMIVEDPFYDEDGQLIDEDDWATAPIDVSEWLDKELKDYDDTYSPYDTVNS